MNKPLSSELIDEPEGLAEKDQERVLAYARSLASPRRRGTKGSDLLKFAGSIPKPDLEKMRIAIEQDCERIDHEGW